MRVKLSFTVDEENVLSETAKIIGLSDDDVQHVVRLFSEVQKCLEDDADIGACYSKIDELRVRLLNVDTRLQEAVEILQGYQEHSALEAASSLPRIKEEYWEQNNDSEL
jgi:hypothetical protein|tara:strand:- start:230 stop:556 length:327 start_codon:yes stop_codon:yes gene_type:complete